jgi:hypothetical protein
MFRRKIVTREVTNVDLLKAIDKDNDLHLNKYILNYIPTSLQVKLAFLIKFT